MDIFAAIAGLLASPMVPMLILLGMIVGGITGGCISAILLRIPGTPNCVATIEDGYAFTLKGQAAKALGLAICASVFGPLFSAIILMTFATILSTFALKFHFPEYVAAFILALSAVIAVSGESLLKGAIAALIGTMVGIVPAVGGSPAGLIAYAQARSAARDPGSFGKGAEGGVVAAEAANNATIGGALITALTLGIPGDTVTAMLVGALTIQGVQPGPLMFLNSPEVVYAIYAAILLASVMMFFFMMGATGPLVRPLNIPKPILLPGLFVVACVGIYSLNGRMFEVWIMCVLGLLGFLLEHFRYPLAPMILGFLLGPPLESNLRQMLGQYGSLMPLVTRPIPLVLLLGAVAFVAVSLRARRRERLPGS
ncbi:tripartite tricarboxylate transporter permease [Sulfitobacter sp. LCG007]